MPIVREVLVVFFAAERGRLDADGDFGLNFAALEPPRAAFIDIVVPNVVFRPTLRLALSLYTISPNADNFAVARCAYGKYGFYPRWAERIAA
mgnify:CR=1 FL=1